MISQIEPGIRELVKEFVEAGSPCSSLQTVEQRRSGYLGSTVLAGAGPEMASVQEERLNGIAVKIYKPSEDENLPITVYFHGGCFVSGGYDTHDQQLRYLAKTANSIVICIQYRLAPEFTYPAAHDDVYRATLAIKEHGKRFGGDTECIVFVGDSAGGHLALVTALRLKRAQHWLPAKQFLIYPMLDPQGASDSYRINGEHFIITAKMLLSGFKLYTADVSYDQTHPELSVLDCDDLTGLPATHIITAEFDPLRDEGELLYKKLLESGVETYCQRYLGVIHGFHQLSGVSQSAKLCLNSIAHQINA